MTIVGYETGPAIVVVGSIQGDQPSTRDLINYLIDDFGHELDRVWADVAFHFIPTINPDGNVAGTRRNAHDVDLNRNWDTPDWTAAPEQPEGVVEGAGGAYPLSEPETRGLEKYLRELQSQNPKLRVVVWHTSYRLSTGGQVYAGYTRDGVGKGALDLARRYADVTGYTVEEEWTYYVTTGELVSWCAINGIDAIDVVIPRSLPGSDRSLRDLTMQALLEIARFP